MSQIDDDELTALWRDGMSVDEIAQRFGVAKRTVYQRRYDLKLPKRPSLGSGGRPQHLDYEKIREMWPTEATLSDIAEAIGSTPGSVRSTAQRLGLAPRSPGRPRQTPVDRALGIAATLSRSEREDLIVALKDLRLLDD